MPAQPAHREARESAVELRRRHMSHRERCELRGVTCQPQRALWSCGGRRHSDSRRGTPWKASEGFRLPQKSAESLLDRHSVHSDSRGRGEAPSAAPQWGTRDEKSCWCRLGGAVSPGMHAACWHGQSQSQCTRGRYDPNACTCCNLHARVRRSGFVQSTRRNGARGLGRRTRYARGA